MKAHVTIALIIGMALLPLMFALVLRQSGKPFVRVATGLGASMAVGAIGFMASGFRLTENLTTSLPGYMYWYKLGEPFKKGDLVAFSWHGGATYPRGSVFIKRVVGVPGDEVIRRGREFWVGGSHVGVAKTHTKAGVPVEPSQPGVIPDGEYFVATPSHDSLDSRYSLTGNIREKAILGKAHELF